MIDVAEILVHWHAGRSLSEMSQSLGVDRKTLRKYVAPAVAAGIVPGGPAKSEQEWHELVREWFPELADTRLRQVTWPAIAGHHDYIVEQLKARVRMSTIHQRLRDERGLAASVASFRRYVNANIPEEIRRSQVTVWNPHPAQAGGQAQIDYGQLGRWLDPVSGKLRTVWAFVMVLACSRHMFVRPVLRMDQRAWTECHVAAFEFFGGVPARLVPDNLKTGVDKPDLYDPKLNRSYAEMAAHYGCLIDPARALKPRDKPQVERPMPYVRDSFWRGREFASLPQMQAGAVRWSLEVAGRRHCRPLDGAAPAAVFEATEKDALRPLPAEPFVLATWATAKIGPDIHAQVEKVLYSVPWQHIGKTADVRITGTMVQFFIGGELVKTHPAEGPREADRLRRLPAGEDRVPHADPGLVPPPGRRDRPVLRAGHRRAAGRERALPAPLGAGRDRAGRQARPGPARGRLRQGGHRRRPVLPDGQGHPGRRDRARPASRCVPGTAARRRSCAAPHRSRTSSPCPGRSPATRSAPGTRRR